MYNIIQQILKVKIAVISIDIISDTVCPWCFIGKKRLDKAIKKYNNMEFEIEWHSFQLNPNMSNLGMDRKTYLSKKFGSFKNAENTYFNIKKAGNLAGIDFNFENISIMPNSFDTHMLVEFSKERNLQNQVVENLFYSFFVEGKNIGNKEILTEIAFESGIEDFNYENLIDRDDLKESIYITDKQNKEIGVSGVPFFIFNKKLAVSGAQESEVFEKVFETCKINN